MLSVEELEELLDEISKRITIANRNETLDELLNALGMHDLVEPQIIPSNKKGKIVVLGGSEVDEQHLLMTANKLGIPKIRFEFCLDYNALQKFNYRKLQYADNYRVVMTGPIPHSTVEKGNSGSIISEMETHPDQYPRVLRIGNNDLKITKSSFKAALDQLIREDYI